MSDVQAQNIIDLSGLESDIIVLSCGEKCEILCTLYSRNAMYLTYKPSLPHRCVRMVKTITLVKEFLKSDGFVLSYEKKS